MGSIPTRSRQHNEVLPLKSDRRYVNYAKYLNFALSFGLTMIFCMLLGYYGGQWLDKYLGTEPIFLIVGLLLGIFASFYSLLAEIEVLNHTEKMLKEKEEKEKEEENKEGKPL